MTTQCWAICCEWHYYFEILRNYHTNRFLEPTHSIYSRRVSAVICFNPVPTKVRCLYQCSKMQFITFQNFHIQTWFSQFLWFFSLKCWFKGQMISRIHLILPNAYKLMCFDRNINGNRNVKFLECDKWSLHWYKNLTLVFSSSFCFQFIQRVEHTFVKA